MREKDIEAERDGEREIERIGDRNRWGRCRKEPHISKQEVREQKMESGQ